ncbi:hypothetical protein Tco_0414037 [Tanacetum coccineum]
MSSYNHLGCSCCGGPFNDRNCPSCSSVGSENKFVYDPNPYSYNETPNISNQPPQHQYETYSCEFYRGNSHPGFDCQTGNTPIFDQGPCYNQDFGFNQPPHYSPSQPQTYSCELCGNDAHYGYDCPPQVPFISNPDPCYNQDFDNFPQTSPNFQQQYLCCENCEGPHETFQCQPLNQNFYEPNHCYNSNSFSFDQSQPSQFPVIHQPPQATSTEMLQARENLMKSIQTFLKKFNRISFRETPKNCHAFYDDDDEEYTIAITPVLPTEEPDNSLSMGEYDVPVCDNFTTFSNPLFDADDDFSSSDDKSFSDEDVPKEIYLNPLFDKEIISTNIDPHHFNVESDLIESMLNQDTSINSSPKIDSLLEEFSGELAHIDLIPPGINEADFDPEEEIRLVEKLLYDNSSARPP